jgi:small redox-active disulfide protein 2
VDIKVLGPGCKNCLTLETRTREALDRLGLDAAIEKVTDPGAIAGYGLLATPGLVVDGQLRVAGQVPTVRRLEALLQG